MAILGCPFIAAKGKLKIFPFSLFGRHDPRGGDSIFCGVKLTQMSITNSFETYNQAVSFILGCDDL